MPSPSFTTTVQNIVSAASQDIRQMLGSSGTDANILMDYTNRVHLDILRRSRWPYTLSGLQYFITEMEQTDYWLGTTGSNPTGSVDTGLNLADIFKIQKNSVYDISNAHQLTQITNPPLSPQLQFPSGQFRANRPAVFRSDPTNPSLMNIYPSSDNSNTWQPVPSAPVFTTGAGGSLSNRIYYIGLTFVDVEGNEGTASDRYAKAFVAANNLITVVSPTLPIKSTASGATYTSYNVYASTSANSVGTKQNASPISLGTNWTEPTSGLTTSGVNPPLTSTLIPMDGYLITFRYYKARPQLTSLATTLSIPDDYKDVVIHGVNALAAKLADRMDDVQLWTPKYEAGVQAIITDKNLFPSGPQFVRPDPAASDVNTMGNLELSELLF